MIAKKLGTVCYAEVEEFCRDVRRRSVLAMGEKKLDVIVTERLTHWTARSRVSEYREASDGGVSVTADPGSRD